MRVFLIAVLVVALLAGGLLYLPDRSGPKEEDQELSIASVTAWNMVPREFQSRVNALGTLRAWESVDITPSVAETIVELHFHDGEAVNKQRRLVTLQQDEEQAGLREGQEMLKEQQREVARLENLARNNQVALTELDQRKTLVEIARIRIERTRAGIEDRTIRAPFAGVLGLRQVSVGALIKPGEVITTLDDISRMRLDFSVPATYLRFLELGQSIAAHSTAYEQTFEGVLTAIGSRVDPATRTVIGRASLDNPLGLLKPGLLMQVVLKGEQRQTLLAPEESLVSRSTTHYVWRIRGDTAERVVVEIGGRKPGWVEIVSGLEAGDKIVRDGVSHLRGNSASIAIVES
ncbi:MAG: efflux RND transporter periplasmic adaptor subunit [Halieaceae bacterium]|jgi:membrane fusion protein, multidrug efflux system|nr:efflux RND transporter periplasmic adaptor subunit [Halieaceae bacterium]